MAKRNKTPGLLRSLPIFNHITKLFILASVIALGVLVLTSMANALVLPPVVSISASPNPAATTSTITAVGIDLSGSGIANVRIYEGGVKVKECTTSSCVYVAYHTSPGVRSYYSTALDNVGGSATSSTISVNFTNSPPILAAIGNKTVEVLSSLIFTLSASDYNGDSLTYSASGLPIGAVFDYGSKTFSWTPSAAALGTHYVNFSVSDGYASDSEVIAIIVVDTQAPQYSGLAATPSSPAIYAPAQTYSFSSTWTDNVAVANVWIGFNGVNYSAAGTSGVYSFTISDLGAGNYTYRWFANDSSGNTNQTALMNYTINVAPTVTTVFANPPSPITYGIGSNFSCSNTGNLASVLYINGIDASAEAGLNITRAAGNYSLNCTSTGNSNYTGNVDFANYTINKAVPILDSSVSSPIFYGIASNYSANESNSGDGDLIYTLARDGMNLANGSIVNDSSVLGAGNYTYNYSTLGGENYTSVEKIDLLVVNKADPLLISSPLNITVLPSNTISWGNESNVSGINCPSELICNLYRNSAPVSNPDIANLSAGVYSYAYNTTGNANYTSGSASSVLTVTKIAPDLHFYLDGVEADENTTYGATTNATASSATSAINLSRNGIFISNPDIGILGAGTYNYTAYAVESENYSSANATRILIINQSISQCLISSTSPSVYPAPINVSASCTNPESSLYLFRNDTDVTSENGLAAVIPAGNWTYKVNVSESQNYTSAANTTIVIVGQGTPIMTYFLNGAAANSTITYNATLNASIYSSAGTPKIFRNGFDVTSENGVDVVLGAGNYTYEFNVTGNENYTSVPSAFLTLTVNRGSAQTSLIFGKSSPQNYSALVNASCSVVAGSGAPALYRNNASADSENGVNVLLGAGSWTYNCTLSGGANYTAGENISTFTINPILMPVHLYIDGVEANKSIAYGSSVNATGTKDFSEGSLSLFREGVLVFNPEIASLGAGFYNYTLDFSATQNFTANSKTFFVNVSQAIPALSLNITPAANASYGDLTNASGSGCPSGLSCNLYRNGVLVSNPDAGILSAGNYTYEYNTTGNVNYTSLSLIGNLTISRAAPLMTYFLNGVSSNLTLEELSYVNASAYSSAGTVGLFRNGSDVTSENGANVSLGLGTYIYEFNVTGNTNYSDVSSEFLTLNVVDSVKPLIWFEGNTAPSGNQTTDSIAVNVSASDLHLSNITISLFDSSGFLASFTSSMANPFFVNFTSLMDGFYYFNATAYDSSGNSNSTGTRTVLIDASVPSVFALNATPNPVFLTQGVTISANITDPSLASAIAQITLPDSSMENITLSGGSGFYSGVYRGTVQNGTYNARIIATDGFGNVNNSENIGFAVNYAVRTIGNSYIYGVYYANNFTYDVLITNVTNATINDSIINGSSVNVSNSIISNSTLSGVTLIDYCQVYDSSVVGGTCYYAYIDPSSVQNSITTGSTIKDSHVWDSNVTYSYVENSTLDFVNANNSNIINSTLANSDVFDSNVTDSLLNNVQINNNSVIGSSNLSNIILNNAILTNTTIGDALNVTFSGGTIANGVAYNGTFTYNNVTVNLTSVGSMGLEYLVNYGPDASLSVSPLTIYAGSAVMFNASGSSDPNIVNGSSIALTFNDSLNYTFYFDTKTGDSLTTNESVISHSYIEVGEYDVYVLVKDSFGKTSSSTGYRITVLPVPKSGGGGGGGGSVCYTGWVCSDWSACENGTKTRICTKASFRCYTNESQPAESLSCGLESDDGENKDQNIFNEFGSKITGAVTGAFGGSKIRSVIIFTLAVLAASGIVWILRIRWARGAKLGKK